MNSLERFIFTLGFLTYAVSSVLADKVVLCYVAGRAVQRPDWAKFTVLDADTSHCTHIVYAFMALDEAKNSIKYYDRAIDLDENGNRQFQFNKLKRLKENNPNVKVLASIKASGDGNQKFSEMVKNTERRKAFVRNMVSILRERSIDGIDICWQFPGHNGERQQDKRNALLLFKELKQAFGPEKRLLTVHILAQRGAMDAYDIREVSNVVDFINFAAMEYNGPRDQISGIMAPLKSDDSNNVISSLDYLISKGANPQKILLGLPLFGHAYVLNTVPTSRRYKGLAMNGTFYSPRTKEGGFIAYAEMCHNLKFSKDWVNHWDEQSQTPVAFNGNKFVSYENLKSLQLKANLVSSKNLGGIMIWSLDLDDFRGFCDGIKFPLTSAISNYVQRNQRPTSSNSNGVIPLSIPTSTQENSNDNEIECFYSQPSCLSSDILEHEVCPLQGTLNVVPKPVKGKVFLCYMVSWAIKRPSHGKFTVADAQNNFCTHIVYAFAHLDESTNEITLASPENRQELLKLKTLKAKKPNLKIMVSVGGYLQGSKRFSRMAADEEARGTFIGSLVNFIKEYNLDGIDICWQHPGLRDGNPAIDRDNSLRLFREIKNVFKPNGYLLTVHILGHLYVIDAYDIRTVAQIVDYINFATMEYHGTWEKTVEITTPLTSSDDGNVKASLDYILNKGVPPNKLLLGLPTFGHTYALAEDPRGKYFGVFYDHLAENQWTKEAGLIAFNELCYEMSLPYEYEWSEEWHDFSQTPIAFSGNILATYENEKSLRFKARLVDQKKLAGVMIWSLDMDDFNGSCKKSGNKKYPLLSAIADGINKQVVISKPTSHRNSTCNIISSGPLSSIVTCDYGSF